MATDKLLINAPNVHSGGASVLLDIFLTETDFTEYLSILLVVDARFNFPDDLSDNIKIKRIKPTIFYRLLNELKIFFFAGNIFCFGNLPPLFSKSKNITVFLHNALYFEPKLRDSFPIKTRWRLAIESYLFRLTACSVNKFLVQTPHMKQRLCEMSIQSSKIIVWPFANIAKNDQVFNSDGSFVCVSSGDAHKNIKNLILAWVLLAQDGHFPRLYLTISKSQYPLLTEWIDKQIHDWDLLISNLGLLPHQEVKKIYLRGSALIYPSFVESLGLPLIEAREAKVDIIAAELDYVRDVVSPVQTFDPNSPISIARSVKRYLKIPTTLIKLGNSKKLLNHLFS